MPVDWRTVTQAHAALAWLVVGLTTVLWLVLRAVDAPDLPRGRTRDLLVVLLAQGAVGYVQYLTELPEILVGTHLLGAALVWIAVLRVLLSVRERGTPVAERPADAAGGTGVGPQRTGPAVREDARDAGLSAPAPAGEDRGHPAPAASNP